MPGSLKQRLAAGELVPVFAIGRLASPIVVDLFALAGGYQGFWLDNEHVALTNDQIVATAVAARANGLDCFIRIPPVGYWLVTQCLEAGMGGVMAAQIHSADQAEQFVTWAKFPPRGQRGLNTGGRDANYTHKSPAQFIVDANRDHFTAIQIETLGALQQADQIAAIEGVDHLFIGPADLSLSLGVPGEFHHPKLWEAIGQVAAACRRHGKSWGAVTPDPQWAARAIEEGCLLPTIGNDLVALRRGINTLQTSFTATDTTARLFTRE